MKQLVIVLSIQHYKRFYTAEALTMTLLNPISSELAEHASRTLARFSGLHGL